MCHRYHRSKNLLRYIKNGNTSNWCQHCNPWHLRMWSKELMLRAWNLQLCLKCWCCLVIAEGAVFYFSFWASFYFMLSLPLMSLVWKRSCLVDEGIHAKAKKSSLSSADVLCTCRSYRVTFFWLSMINVCLMLSLPLILLAWIDHASWIICTTATCWCPKSPSLLT